MEQLDITMEFLKNVPCEKEKRVCLAHKAPCLARVVGGLFLHADLLMLCQRLFPLLQLLPSSHKGSIYTYLREVLLGQKIQQMLSSKRK